MTASVWKQDCRMWRSPIAERVDDDRIAKVMVLILRDSRIAVLPLWDGGFGFVSGCVVLCRFSGLPGRILRRGRG